MGILKNGPTGAHGRTLDDAMAYALSLEETVRHTGIGDIITSDGGRVPASLTEFLPDKGEIRAFLDGLGFAAAMLHIYMEDDPDMDGFGDDAADDIGTALAGYTTMRLKGAPLPEEFSGHVNVEAVRV